MNIGQKIMLEATWVERDKKDKSGKYQCFEIKVGNSIKKLVFMTDAELELLMLSKKI